MKVPIRHAATTVMEASTTLSAQKVTNPLLYWPSKKSSMPMTLRTTQFTIGWMAKTVGICCLIKKLFSTKRGTGFNLGYLQNRQIYQTAQTTGKSIIHE